MHKTVKLSELKISTRLANQLAKEIVTYIEQGYSLADIARTSSRLLLNQLESELTEAAINLIPRGGNGQPAVDRETAIQAVILEFSLGYLAEVSDRIKKSRLKP
jgi:hypothetical protein